MPIDAFTAGHTRKTLARRAQKQADPLPLGVFEHQQRRWPLLVAQQPRTQRREAISRQVRQIANMAKMLPEPGLQPQRITGAEVQGASIGEQPMGLQCISHWQIAGDKARVAHVPASQPTHTQRQQQHRRIGPASLLTPTPLTAYIGWIKPWVGRLPGQPGQRRAQLPGITAPTVNPHGLFGIGGQIQLHRPATLRVQALIDIGVQLAF
ncbi:hypothetical protein D3C78_871020 [compost metagenome]